MSDWVAVINEGLVGYKAHSDTVPRAWPPTAGAGIVPTVPFELGTWQFQSPLGPIPFGWSGYVGRGVQSYWFDAVHYMPYRVELGNFLTLVLRDIYFYSAYKRIQVLWLTGEANAGEGVDLVNMPSLPHWFETQTGRVFQVRATLEGPAIIDGTLDFTFDVATFVIPITGTRVVMFATIPEAPVTEVLQWHTDILVNQRGQEQRIAGRKCPRQFFRYQYRLETDHERRCFLAMLFGFHKNTFGIPVWHEARYPLAPIPASQDEIVVDTRYGDFRVGGTLVLWEDWDTYDALQIVAIDGNVVRCASNVSRNYGLQTLVMPVRFAYADNRIGVERWLNNLEDIDITWEVVETDNDLANTEGWRKHEDKIVMDDPNWVPGQTLPDGIAIEVVRVDNLSGVPVQFSSWLQSRVQTRKGWVCMSKADTWRVRQLLHALRGSQVSFYLPTFFADLIVVEQLDSGTPYMNIQNIGYTKYLAGNEPNRAIRIELVDGTVLTRTVIGTEELSGTVERLEMSGDWPYEIPVDNIRLVSFMRLSRITDDAARLVHDHTGETKIEVQVTGVQQ